MGKLHSLTIGSDVCATLHMDLSFEDLDWCLDSIIHVRPSHLMSLPTKNDPMLGISSFFLFFFFDSFSLSFLYLMF